MTDIPLVSILVPARDEAGDIATCLAAVLAQDHPRDRLEVVVVDGGSTDGTAAVAGKILANAGIAHQVVTNPVGTTPSNLNVGLGHLHGEIVCRVDARSIIPSHYARRCAEVLAARPDVVVVGGAQVAVARDGSDRAVGIARALNNKWGMGGSRYRRGAKDGPSDTVYLGAFRTAELRDAGGWDERFTTNQDYELNRRMGERGTVWFDASLEVGYRPRATLRALLQQYQRFGAWKVRYWRTTGQRPQPRQLALIVAPLLAPLAAVALWRRLTRRGRGALGVLATAAVAVFETSGPTGPPGPAGAHLASVAASGAVGAGWLAGVVSESIAPTGTQARAASAHPSVVYVASRWGEPSQTFVRREAAALRDLGVEVHAASLKAPVACDPRVDVVWLSRVRVVRGVVLAFGRHPIRVARVFATVVARSAPVNIARQSAAAAIGVAWAGSRRLPEGHLHAHFGWVAATAAWAAARVDSRTFSVFLHAFEIHDQRYVDGFTSVPLRQATAVFTHSDRDREIVADRFGVAPTLARLGVPRSWLADPSADRDPGLVVSVGRLVEKKGHGVLLEALARAEGPWRCVIIGDGPLRGSLQQQITKLGLHDRVTLAGALPEAEVATWLRQASVSCLASVETASGDRDGSPVALIEAMASGAAVVATDTGAIAELLAGAGLVVPAGDADAMAEALDQLADPAYRRGLAQRAAARVDDELTSDRTARVVARQLGLERP